VGVALVATLLYARFRMDLSRFSPGHGLQFAVAPSAGFQWLRFAVDGLAAPVLLVSSWVAGLVALGRRAIVPNAAISHLVSRLAAPLVIGAGTTALWTALDGRVLLLAYVVTTAGLVLALGERRGGAVRGLLLREGLSIVLLACALLLLHTGAQSVAGGAEGRGPALDLDLLAALPSDRLASATVLGLPVDQLALLLVLGAAVLRLSIFPLHAHLPGLFEAAGPTAAMVPIFSIIAGLSLVFRLGLPVLPGAAVAHAGMLAWLGVASILGSGLSASSVVLAVPWRASNGARTLGEALRRLAGYGMTATAGWALLGAASGTHAGLAGALYVALAQGAALALVLLIADACEYSGEAGEAGEARPTLAMVRWIRFSLLAILGVPTLGPFVGQGMVLLGAFPHHGNLALAAGLGAVLLASGVGRALVRSTPSLTDGTMSGAGQPRPQGGEHNPFPLGFVGLAGLGLVLGVYPALVLERMHPSLVDLLTRLSRHAGAAALALFP
jgi:NADH-quinone oxidoreductase subunit M